jgi:hypothetical protein
MLDLHHIPNARDAVRVIKKFDINTGVSIALPLTVHKNIRAVRFRDINSARGLLASEILYLRSCTPIPSTVLLKIIELNKTKYPESFKKGIR